jgi:catechol-2,3-dioxygenase
MFNYTNSFSSFSVGDLQKAKAFYQDILELKVKENAMGVLEIQTGDAAYVMIYPKPNHEAATFTVLNFEVKNIKETVDALTKRGVQFEQYEAPIKTDEKGICRNADGHAIAWFKDPAGNILSVIQDRHHLAE